jgi:hypothetical protein
MVFPECAGATSLSHLSPASPSDAPHRLLSPPENRKPPLTPRRPLGREPIPARSCDTTFRIIDADLFVMELRKSCHDDALRLYF